jgi:methionine synthase I (cobalamin-dependent)
MLEVGGLGDSFEDINLKAIYAAQEAKRKTKRDDILIAGSLSHRLPISDGAKQADPKHGLSENRLKENCEEMALFLADNGCDIIILEMMYHPDRMQSVFEAAAKSRKPIWAGFSTRLSDTGLVLSFMEEDDIPFENVVSIVKDFKIDVAGIMHTDVNAVSESLKVLKKFFDGPLMVYPDSGGWVSPNWDFDKVIQPTQLKSFAKKWINEGVNIIGGCCGLSPNHIKEIAQLK